MYFHVCPSWVLSLKFLGFFVSRLIMIVIVFGQHKFDLSILVDLNLDTTLLIVLKFELLFFFFFFVVNLCQ